MEMQTQEIGRAAQYFDPSNASRYAATRILDSFYLECRLMPELEYEWYAGAMTRNGRAARDWRSFR